MTHPKPTVSVIIAAYNGIERLNQTIHSVLRQTYSDFEILLYGNLTLAQQEYFKQISDSRLQCIFQPNLNIFQAFNQGIIQARGKYITFLQANDFWHSSKLRKQVSCLNREPEIGLIYSWIVPINRQGKSQGRVIKHSSTEYSRTDILERNRIHYQSVMVRRSCFNKVGLFDLELESVQDWDMWIRLSRRYQFMAIAQPLVFCQQQANTSQSWLVMETNLQQTIEKAYNSVTSESLALKSRSYAYASLHLAWEVLENREPDPLIAGNYRRQALEHYPPIGFSLFFFRVSLAIVVLYCLKGDRYHQFKFLIQSIQRLSITTCKQLKISFDVFLKWLLAEEESLSWWKENKIERQGKD